MAKSRWDLEVIDNKGRPLKRLSPEGWFAYCTKKAGGITPLAERMGVTRQNVHACWHDRFPDKYVVKAEQEFGIPRALLAPHLYE